MAAHNAGIDSILNEPFPLLLRGYSVRSRATPERLSVADIATTRARSLLERHDPVVPMAGPGCRTASMCKHSSASCPAQRKTARVADDYGESAHLCRGPCRWAARIPKASLATALPTFVMSWPPRTAGICRAKLLPIVVHTSSMRERSYRAKAFRRQNGGMRAPLGARQCVMTLSQTSRGPRAETRLNGCELLTALRLEN
jgi:hypothetical protein